MWDSRNRTGWQCLRIGLVFLAGAMSLPACDDGDDQDGGARRPTETATPAAVLTVSPTPPATATATGPATLAPSVTASLTLTRTPTPTPTPTATATLMEALPSECEILNGTECLLPYPSSHFLALADTATGYAVRIPAAGIPRVRGPNQIDPAIFSRLDGFSPGSQILMHFPQGVDVAASNAPRLLPPQCCGQPPGPPWIDTRTMNQRSLEPDSPTVLLDADTGERILHFVENDARATDPARRAFILRPGRILTPGHRYIVAARNLVAPGGASVEPEPAFRRLRDRTPSGDPALEARRAHFEDVIFPRLAAAGVARDDLVLAFDFVVASENGLHGLIRSMRDQAFSWLDGVASEPELMPFTVTSVMENDCNAPDTVVWRTISGTYQVPLFLTGDLANDTTPVENLGPDGEPVQNGFHTARFFATLPCSALEPVEGSPNLPVLMGHGLFQTGDVYPTLVPPIAARIAPWTGIAFGTDWRGLSGLDLAWLGARIFGINESQLHNFPAFPARLRQGVLNTLVLARLIKLGLFNRHAAFQRPDATGVLPGENADPYYIGFSLGGIMGTYLAGLTPDIHRFTLNVGAVNFACLLQRATPFEQFYPLISSLLFDDPLSILLGIELLHELWSSAEPVSVVHHITSDPLPGSGSAKQILYTAAWLDNQVANICTEIAARTMQLPVAEGSIQRSMVQMTDATGATPSALVFHHLGELDILDPAHAPFIPPLANLFPAGECDPHGRQASTPASIRQILRFFISGEVVNTCSGLCDGNVPDEVPLLGSCVPRL